LEEFQNAAREEVKSMIIPFQENSELNEETIKATLFESIKEYFYSFYKNITNYFQSWFQKPEKENIETIDELSNKIMIK
jgi:hypothetical protein